MDKALEVFDLFEQRELNVKYFADRDTALRFAQEHNTAMEIFNVIGGDSPVYKVTWCK